VVAGSQSPAALGPPAHPTQDFVLHLTVP